MQASRHASGIHAALSPTGGCANKLASEDEGLSVAGAGTLVPI